MNKIIPLSLLVLGLSLNVNAESLRSNYQNIKV